MADLAAAALALYNAINPAEMAKVESGELTYVGNKIPAAFAAACTHGVPASSTFTEVFAAKAGESGYDIYASPGMAATALALYTRHHTCDYGQVREWRVHDGGRSRSVWQQDHCGLRGSVP